MAGLRDYIRGYGTESFDDLPLTELDVACLNELGYLSFDEYLPVNFDFQRFYPLKDLLALAFEETELTYDFLVTKERLELFELIVDSPRFAGLELGFYVNDIQTEYEQQFAAMAMRLPSLGHTQVIFRGTDDTLVGWKEDFNMSYRRVIPAQYAATAYLRQFLETNPCPLVVSGHSKGGNLVLYASSQLPKDLQSQLKQLLVFDAPGLHQSVLTSQGYRAIRDRVLAFRPKDSIVGIMLDADVTYQTVDSQGFGMEQHDMMNWLVTETAFTKLAGLSDFSLSLEQTFSDWLSQYSKSDLKLYFDTFFDIFFTSGISSLNDLDDKTAAHFKAMLLTVSNMDRHRRDWMWSMTAQLLSLYQKHAIENAWNSRLTELSELVNKWLNKKDFN